MHVVHEYQPPTSWEMLVHVCRRWRYIVLAAPRHLGLRLLCTAKTRVKEMLDIWPPFHIDLRACGLHPLNEDNIIAMLGHNDRICTIVFAGMDKGSLRRLAAVMQVPFPALTLLHLESCCVAPTILPVSFLGGSAPGLRSLYLDDITASELPKLLPSATGLIRLSLQNIPDSWFFSPYVMVDCLSSLTRLEEFSISFFSPPPFEQESLRSAPLTRTILPKLNSLSLHTGRHEYLEVLFTWIDAPLHNHISISFFDPAIFDISRISLFNGREELIQVPDRAYMHFDYRLLHVILSSPKGSTRDTSLLVTFEYGDIAWQLSTLNQFRSRFSPPLGRHSSRSDGSELPHWTSDLESVRWLEFLHFFAGMENLYLSGGVALFIAPALRELATGEGGAVSVLPALKNLFMENLEPSKSGPLLESIEEFVVARESAGHPVVIRCWEEK